MWFILSLHWRYVVVTSPWPWKLNRAKRLLQGEFGWQTWLASSAMTGYCRNRAADKQLPTENTYIGQKIDFVGQIQTHNFSAVRHRHQSFTAKIPSLPKLPCIRPCTNNQRATILRARDNKCVRELSTIRATLCSSIWPDTKMLWVELLPKCTSLMLHGGLPNIIRSLW